jgi:GntR family transcriptional regulator
VPGPGVGDRARLKHESVRRHLLAAMRDELDPGGKLPSERELAERLGVSRPTVRRALEQLAVEGRVHRVHGSGTFAAPAPPRADGPGALRLLAAEAVLAGAEPAARLGVSPGEPLWRVERLRVVDGVPVSLEVTHVVRACAPRLLDHPLDGPLHERYDVAIVRVRQRVTATVLEPSAAQALEAPPLSPALAIERVASDGGGRRVELAECLCRGDRYVLELALEQPAGECFA